MVTTRSKSKAAEELRALPKHAARPAGKSAPKVVAPKVVAPKVVAPKVVAPKVVAPKVVAPKVVAPKVVAPNAVAPKPDARKAAVARHAAVSRKAADARKAVDAHKAHAPASVEIMPNKRADKEKNILYFRVVLATAIVNQFNGTAWLIPKIEHIKDPKYKSLPMSRKIGAVEHRCMMSMEEDTASFKLTPVSTESLDGFKRSFAAYVEAYDKWRVRQELQNDKDYDLSFSLNAQTIEDLKTILKGMPKNCNVTKYQLQGKEIPADQLKQVKDEIAAEKETENEPEADAGKKAKLKN